MNSGVTSGNKKSERFVWIDGSIPVEKTLGSFSASETTNVDDVMHVAHFDAAVATAPLNGSVGIAQVMQVQLLEKRKICVIKQSIDLLLRGRRQGALGSFTLSSNMAHGRMISSQTLVLSLGILHADIHDLVVEVPK